MMQVVGMNWVQVTAGRYQVLEGKDKRSLCQYEVMCECVDISIRELK